MRGPHPSQAIDTGLFPHYFPSAALTAVDLSPPHHCLLPLLYPKGMVAYIRRASILLLLSSTFPPISPCYLFIEGGSLSLYKKQYDPREYLPLPPHFSNPFPPKAFFFFVNYQILIELLPSFFLVSTFPLSSSFVQYVPTLFSPPPLPFQPRKEWYVSYILSPFLTWCFLRVFSSCQ